MYAILTLEGGWGCVGNALRMTLVFNSYVYLTST